MAGQWSRFTDGESEAQVAWYGPTDTFPSLKPEGSHLPTPYSQFLGALDT